MGTTHPPLVRTRLSIMMFLEFFIWGSWGFALTGYAIELGFTGPQIGWLGAIMAIGAIVSPLFVGMVADRFFAAQRMLAVLHLLGAVCLIVAGTQTSFPALLTLMMLNGLFFMPSIALVNTVAFKHIPDPDKFPRIAVLGTIGWIAAVLLASSMGGAKEPNFLFQAGVGGIILALYALTLPNTPPKGAEAGGDAFGIDALKLLKDSNFLVFVVCVFLFSIPACGFFFTLSVPMFIQRGYPSPFALTTLNQFSEIIFMFTMPWFVAKLGLKRVILIGMAAWAIRYVCFAMPDFNLTLIALILHGFCYSFFYVGAYMYVDKWAPADMKASAQSLMAFLMLGVGWLAGGNLGGVLMGMNKSLVDTEEITVAAYAVTVEEDGEEKIAGEITEAAAFPRWDDPNASAAWGYLDLGGNVAAWVSGEKAAPKPDLAQQVDTNADGKIELDEINAIEDKGVKVDGFVYKRDALAGLFKAISPNEDSSLTRDEYLTAQSCNWWPIWMYPSIALFVLIAVFAVAFRETPSEEQAPAAEASDA